MPVERINGIDMYYEIAGQGQPVLFLHGLGSSTADWQPQLAAFQDRYRVIAVDVRGHGQSEKPPGPYSMKLFAQDMAALLDHLGHDAAHLVGLSLGGMLAFQMMADMPERVTSAAIVNSGPEVPMRTLSEKMAIWQRLVLFQLFSMQKIGEILSQRLFPDEHQADLRAIFVEKWAQNDKRAYMDATRALAGWGVMAHIGGMQQPVLAIASDMDYTPVEMKQAFVDHMPNAELVVIEDARHAVPFAQPDKFNPVLAAWLDRVAG